VKKPVEHGNVLTSVILGLFSIIIAIITRRDFYVALFWVPIWMGLFLYDVPFKRVWKSRIDVIWMILIFLISVYSIYVNLLLIIPYLIFLSDYALRLYLAFRRLNYVGTILGMLAFVFLFVETVNISGFKEIYLLTSLFIYMVGAEFTVNAFISKRKSLLLYNVIPVFLSVLNPVFLIFALSLIRIPVAIKARGLKIIGITETSLLLAVTVVISLFYLLRI
jgi:hypothetical protein